MVSENGGNEFEGSADYLTTPANVKFEGPYRREQSFSVRHPLAVHIPGPAKLRIDVPNDGRAHPVTIIEAEGRVRILIGGIEISATQ